MIDTYKAFYIENGKTRKYNVPLFLKLSDSHGNCYHREHDYDWDIFDHLAGNMELHSGEKIKIWVEVDSSFNIGDYDIAWCDEYKRFDITGKGAEFEIELSDKMVGHCLSIVGKIKTNNNWHKRPQIDCDDIVKYVIGEILPPVHGY